MISMDKKYKTRDGREVRIYAVDVGGCFPVQGAVLDGKVWIMCCWHDDGIILKTGTPNEGDLIEIEPPKPKLCAWMDEDGRVHWVSENYKGHINSLSIRVMEYDIEAKT